MPLNLPFRRRTEEDSPELLAHRASGKPRALCFIRGADAGTWGRFPDLLLSVPELEDYDLLGIHLPGHLRFDVAAAWSTPPALERLAAALRKAASLEELKAYESIAMIAHSIGALVLQRALLDDGELRRRLSHVVLFGAPSGGVSPPATFKAWKRYVREMEPPSAFITDLRTRWDRSATRPAVLSVAASNDSFVIGESALGPFAPQQQAVAFATHLELVDPKTPEDLAVRALVNHVLGRPDPAGPGNAARVALATRNFQRVLEDLAPRKAELDADHRYVLAAAYEGMGRIDEALDVLRDRGMDATGILAGRRKRRWLAGGDATEAEAALALYRRGHDSFKAGSDSPLAVYHAMNLALLALAYKQDVNTCKSYASLALHHAMSEPSTEKWRLFAEGCAYLMLGEDEVSLVRYRQALGLGPSPREIESMLEQASQITVVQDKPEMAKRLQGLFRRPGSPT